MHVKQQYGWKIAKKIMDDNGIIDIELEILFDWYAEGEKRKNSDIQKKDLFETGVSLGTQHIKVGGSNTQH